MISDNEGNSGALSSEREIPYVALFVAARKFYLVLLTLLITWFRSSDLVAEIMTGKVEINTVLPVVLVAETVLLGFLWMISADHELTVLGRHIGTLVPRRKFVSVLIAYSVPVLVTILAALSNSIMLYSLVYWLYISSDVWARKTVTTHVYAAIRKKSAVGGENEISSCLYNYYVAKPFELRGYLLGTSGLAVFCFAVSNRYFVQDQAISQAITTGLFTAQILTVFLGEISIWKWRHHFYSTLEKCEDDDLVETDSGKPNP